MYLDTVFNEQMKVVFSGAPWETEAWLYQNSPEYNDLFQVSIASIVRMVTVEEYLERANADFALQDQVRRDGRRSSNSREHP